MNTDRLLLCTDLDRTLLPNGPQPESPQARARFAALAARPEIDLVYVTGRDQARVREAIASYQLPQPDYVIADVGTSIYRNEDDTWHPLHAWQTEITRDWRDISGPEIRVFLHNLESLQAQEDSKQGLFKLSYYVPLQTDKTKLLSAINALLQQHGIRANLIWSIDEPAGTGLLDILPASATKYHALDFLRCQTAHAVSYTLFAGDSGNDLDILGSEIPAVLVANASAEVEQDARTAAATRGHTARLYVAKGDFLGMNGNYSAGILEGFAHYFPHLAHWLSP
ncbi:MAG: HAD-IIB family hydrolase [Gammaproteobacteria bacterium]